jgi:hypothetical protein
MKNEMIKISQTQWLASGIRKGYVIPEKDGTFTLNKEAQLAYNLGKAVGPALAGAGKTFFGSALRSGLTGAGVGALASIFSKTNLLQSAQDWWKGGSETPEMLKALQNAQARFQQEVKSRLGGISDRLDNDLKNIDAKLSERIATISQRLTERGIGPAFEAGKRLLEEDELMNDMLIATGKSPTNYEALTGKTTGDQLPPAPTPAAAPSAPTPVVSTQPAAADLQAAPKAKPSGTGTTAALMQRFDQ